MTHPLDHPAWNSLIGKHAPLSQGNDLARRYRPEVNVFAGVKDNSAESLRTLYDIVPAGEQVYLFEKDMPPVPPGMTVVKEAEGVQLISTRPFSGSLPDIGELAEGEVLLGDADSDEMVELTALTQPGPFSSKTHHMGHFIGIRIDGSLAAMGGERFTAGGFTEVTAVCVHPDFRRLGLARYLTAKVAAHIEARGETPFIQAWATNTPAITLYETMGFKLRTMVNVLVIERE